MSSREEPSTPSLAADSQLAKTTSIDAHNEAQANDTKPTETSPIDALTKHDALNAHNALDAANTTDLSETASLSQKMRTQERQIIIQTLQKYHWNQKISAEKLGLSYHQLRGLLKKHEMLPLKAFKSQLN